MIVGGVVRRSSSQRFVCRDIADTNGGKFNYLRGNGYSVRSIELSDSVVQTVST